MMYIRAIVVVCGVLLAPFLMVPPLVQAESTSTPTLSEDEEGVAVVASSTPEAPIHDAANIEKRVRELFADVPVMAEIARCESRFRQYTDAGAVFRGGMGNGMVGVFQFHERVHKNGALSLGFDLHSLDGNLGYARYLYEQEGTDPWLSSIACWKTKEFTGSSKTSSGISRDLSMGVVHDEVRTLQQLLNKAGFTIAATGPGSPGSETNLFGSLTRSALRSFQCAEKIACSGDEYTTGYGYVGEKTRVALATYAKKAPQQVSVPKSVAVKTSLTSKERATIEAKIAELLKVVAELQKQLALL